MSRCYRAASLHYLEQTVYLRVTTKIRPRHPARFPYSGYGVKLGGADLWPDERCRTKLSHIHRPPLAQRRSYSMQRVAAADSDGVAERGEWYRRL